jgi:transcriptional regulator with PAS, ATPase and Fis domain
MQKFHAICFQQESISVLNHKEIVSSIQKPIVKSILSFDYECELIWFNASYANNKKYFTIAAFRQWEARITQTKGTLTTVNKRQKQTKISKKNTKNNKTHLRNFWKYMKIRDQLKQ